MHKIISVLTSSKALKIASAIVSVAGMALNFVSGKIEDAKLDNKISEKIAEELSKTNK